MFQWLGDCLSKGWIVVLGFWLVAMVALRMTAPPFNEMAKGGEFVFLPEDMPSRQGEALLGRAFPARQTTSSIVIVVHRDEGNGLTEDDRTFIDETLKPALEKIRDLINESTPKSAIKPVEGGAMIKEIHTLSDQGIGALLISEDQKASLVTMDLATDFQDTRNWGPVQDVSDLLNKLEQGKDFPQGLQLSLTGSATLGRDMTRAESDSARNTSMLTIVLVVVLLVVIYRAPLMAIIPLITLFVAVDVSLHLLTLLAKAGYVPLFMGLQQYTTVITYGPGIDYCLFLIARYKENLNECVPQKQALVNSIGQVGSAIVASAVTVICGIGMLTFAQFGKFHEAGIGISITLLVTLIAVLSLTPSLLFMVGHWAFWPKPGVRCGEEADQSPLKADVAVQKNLFQPMWTFMGGVIERHPMALLLGTVAAMLPFVVFAVMVYGRVNYGLLEALPKTATSAVGAQVLEKHFPAGITGPVEVLLQDSSVDFRSEEGIEIVSNLVEKLMKRREEFQLSDIRSVADPLGTNAKTREAESSESSFTNLFEHKVTSNRSVEHYVTRTAELDGHVTALDLVLNVNPFSMESVRILDRLQSVILQELPADQVAKSSLAFVGPTASVRDVNTISQSDQKQIYALVVGCVLAILVILLRSLSVSIYLIVTVLLSYLATLGITWGLFYLLDPKGFVGLDWTVPLFLFVVLIAVGEDYNIFLVTRIHEEQRRHGPTHGVIVALSRTGGIITSCGFIMAGTFSSLCAGSLARMQELGFALAFGVLLDTFIIRPILVPAFLIVLNDERYGNLARYLK